MSVIEGVVGKIKSVTIATKIVTADPFRRFVCPSLINTFPCRFSIKGPAMAFYQTYLICILIVLDLGMEDLILANVSKLLTIQYRIMSLVSFLVPLLV